MSIIPFIPPRFGSNPHFQTISAHLLGKIRGYAPKQIGLLNESIVLPVQAGLNDRLLLHVHRFHRADRKKTPAVLLVHGLEGSSDSIYILKMARKLLSAGFHVVRMNLRGCGDGRPLARLPYNAGLTIDLESALKFTAENISPIIAVAGYSIGANVVLKFLGEDQDERNRQRMNYGGDPVRFRRAERYAQIFCVASPPLDLYASCEYLDTPTNTTYKNQFLREIKRRVDEGTFDGSPYGRDEVEHINSWFEFDHVYVAPTAGFPGAIEYYATASSRFYVRHIEIPGLILHAEDDPIINPHAWDEVGWGTLRHLTPHLTKRGGHVGWISRKHPYIPDRRWMDYRLLTYLVEWRDSLFPRAHLLSSVT